MFGRWWYPSCLANTKCCTHQLVLQYAGWRKATLDDVIDCNIPKPHHWLCKLEESGDLYVRTIIYGCCSWFIHENMHKGAVSGGILQFCLLYWKSYITRKLLVLSSCLHFKYILPCIMMMSFQSKTFLGLSDKLFLFDWQDMWLEDQEGLGKVQSHNVPINH